MQERDLTADPVLSKTDYGSEQLIHSQWASGRKLLPGESFALMLGREKPVMEPVWRGWAWNDQELR